jgi:hypothetical protein
VTILFISAATSSRMTCKEGGREGGREGRVVSGCIERGGREGEREGKTTSYLVISRTHEIQHVKQRVVDKRTQVRNPRQRDVPQP